MQCDHIEKARAHHHAHHFGAHDGHYYRAGMHEVGRHESKQQCVGEWRWGQSQCKDAYQATLPSLSALFLLTLSITQAFTERCTSAMPPSPRINAPTRRQIYARMQSR
eukprot:5589100-Pleurochrysis_carterae.AAC.1